ncbi:hypothetical protein BWI96_10400 [Siphonobacter sp. SORGH_AS_0500]|uniref:hypothetical protein n=1 Tax=Siphonobacter sp. SORGH_AS_0500 TaxID=1864824 RepID=UPI000CC66CA3|nr:hypothetical protein [Siphonobacter sp. SORGH_AS_0500]PKK36772.1 hypothetical protein BWI96_10400 [Siphonobacter sp. SORGH_AS_0500]
MNWVKFWIFIVIYLHHSSVTLAQKTPITHDLGQMCEGRVFEIGTLDEFSCFHITIGSRNCPNTVAYKAEDKSENIEVSGATPISRRIWKTYTSDGINYIKVWLYTFKAEKTTDIKIICNSPVDVVIPEGCITAEKSHVDKRTYAYKLEVVPKPPTPSLSVEKYISPGAVNFIASGCPTDKEGYDYQWNNVYCKEHAGNNFFIGNKDGTLPGAGGTNYRVLCSALNGTCVSEPSKFESGLSYGPPDLSLVESEYVEQN